MAGILHLAAAAAESAAQSAVETLVTESEVAQKVSEDLNNMKPDAIVESLKKLYPLLLALGYELLISGIILFVSSRIIHVFNGFLERFLKRLNMDLAVVKFLSSVFKIFCYVLVAFGISERIGVNQASLIALLGSAGVAIGLAWQGSLSNFAGGILVLFSKPFLRGDYIITPHGEGSVDMIGVIYTTLITADNKKVTIPNGILSNDVITNVTANPLRRLDISVEVSYDSDLSLAKRVFREAMEGNGMIVKDHEILSFVSSLGASSVVLGGRAWCKTEDYWPALWSILEEVKIRFDKVGVTIPYQQLDVHLHDKNSRSKI